MWPPLFILFLAIAFALLVLVVGAIAVVVAVASAMPWLLILAGVWLLITATRSAGRDHRAGAARRPRPQRAQRMMPARSVQPQSTSPRPPIRPRRELPIDVQVKAEQIRRKADVLLGYADRFPPYSRDLHIVRQTAAEYLPRTISAYLALPGDDDPVVAATGKTALQELREQLRLLDAKLDDITQALQRNDLDRMAANRRFLEERFDLHGQETSADPQRQGTDAA